MGVPTPAVLEAALPDISHTGLHFIEEEVTKVEVIEEVFVVAGEVEYKTEKHNNSAIAREFCDKKKEKEVNLL